MVWKALSLATCEGQGVLTWLCGWGQRLSGWAPPAGTCWVSHKQDLKAGQADLTSLPLYSWARRPLHTGVPWAAFQALPRTDHAAESCLHSHHRDLGQASLLHSHPPEHRPLGLVFLTSREQEPKARGPGSISFSPQRLAPAVSLFPTSSSPISVPLFPMLTLMDSRLFWRRHSVLIENTKFVCLGPHRHRL